MSNKELGKCWPTDREIRKVIPPKAWAGTVEQVVITKISGFELFNTRPYHNHETWSDGWRVEGRDIYEGISVEAEDLDDAVTQFLHKVKSTNIDATRTHEDAE